MRATPVRLAGGILLFPFLFVAAFVLWVACFFLVVGFALYAWATSSPARVS